MTSMIRPTNSYHSDYGDWMQYSMEISHQFYMATGKVLKGVYTAEEWAAWAARLG